MQDIYDRIEKLEQQNNEIYKFFYELEDLIHVNFNFKPMLKKKKKADTDYSITMTKNPSLVVTNPDFELKDNDGTMKF